MTKKWKRPGKLGSLWRMPDGALVRIIGRHMVGDTTMLEYRYLKLQDSGRNEWSDEFWHFTELSTQVSEKPDLPPVKEWLVTQRMLAYCAAWPYSGESVGS